MELTGGGICGHTGDPCDHEGTGDITGGVTGDVTAGITRGRVGDTGGHEGDTGTGEDIDGDTGAGGDTDASRARTVGVRAPITGEADMFGSSNTGAFGDRRDTGTSNERRDTAGCIS
ncbi:MAG: hypothetical protein EBU46_18315 [Nitrosomonadaceae bacterium]|nr:hypothetical protein [Nitrosomonadaceae bacterium]